MLKLVRAAAVLLGLTATAAGALPMYSSRYVDDKSGYVVETRDGGGWLHVSGRHPDSGASFKVKVSRAGRVVGTWNGKAVDYVIGDKPDVQLAQAAAAAGGK